MKTKNEPIIACHPPLCICKILPEVNYEWAKEVLLEKTPRMKNILANKSTFCPIKKKRNISMDNEF